VDPFEGFREFVHGRGPALTRTAYLLTGDRAAAEDLVQSALVKTAARWRSVVDHGNPEAYVRRVMMNDHVSWWRRWGRREAPAPDLSERSYGDESDAAARRLDLASALARLPARQRAAVVLRFYEDRSVSETAAILNCSVGTVKSQTADALASLRRLVPTMIDDSTEVTR
jgi:RNA polymerase sigma-70 factor (sigma-E family)